MIGDPMNELTFEDELKREPVDVLRASLQFARAIAYPRLDVSACVEEVEALAEQARHWLQQGTLERRWISTGLSDCQKGELLSDFLFTQQGFRGNSQEYGDPRNSYLNEVLKRRLGIPITLSVLYTAVAQRLDIPAVGIGLPGHFIVRTGTNCYLDPYHGGERLAEQDCARLVGMATGYSGPFDDEWLKPLTPQATLTRMLNNLRSSYWEQEDWTHTLRVVEHLRMLHPDMPDLLRDLGRIYHHQGLRARAVEYYVRYLNARPQMVDEERVQRWMRDAVRHLAERN